MPKVSISTAGHEVVVESDEDDLATVASAALEIHQATKDPAMLRGYGAVGFTSEIAPQDD